ncbi:MAG: helix-turn-helix domain-containing protein [Clostridiales bacterium]|nr:helix-turn-helix domain-containing protein [Clostridiales bacterium]
MYGQRIKELREEKGMTQAHLASLLSTTQSTVGKYEREELQPSIEMIAKLCQVFGASAGYLLGIED